MGPATRRTSQDRFAGRPTSRQYMCLQHPEKPRTNDVDALSSSHDEWQSRRVCQSAGRHRRSRANHSFGRHGPRTVTRALHQPASRAFVKNIHQLIAARTSLFDVPTIAGKRERGVSSNCVRTVPWGWDNPCNLRAESLQIPSPVDLVKTLSLSTLFLTCPQLAC